MGYNSNIQRDDWECDEMFTNENLKRLILPLVVEQILAVTIGMRYDHGVECGRGGGFRS